MIRALLLCLLLTACARPELGAMPDPILYEKPKGPAHSVVIGIPGALTSIRVLEPIEAFRGKDRGTAYYRLPGYDDLPARTPFSINIAAGQVATFVRDQGFEEVFLVGHSTGAAIAMETAKVLHDIRPDIDVHIAGISTALPAPQPLLSGLRNATGTVAAALRARSLRPRTVWIEQYRRISYGPDASHHAEVIAKANALVRERGEQIQLPSRGLGLKHFWAILGWQNNRPERLDAVDTVFWHGGVDPVFRAAAVERFAGKMSQSKVHVLDHHGHIILLTYPEIWSEMADHWGF